MITRQPADSIIVYATSAGQRASDGEGRNGLFTSQLLPNLTTPGLEVSEVFRRTGADVSRASASQQIPAIYSQFFGAAWLGTRPDETGAVPMPTLPFPRPYQPDIDQGRSVDATRLWSIGASLGSSFSAPWLIGTVRGTVAPLRHSFLELGFDAGLISGISDVGYYSLYPFAHVAYYLPFTLPLGKQGLSSGWYIGVGGGYMFSQYDFPEGKVSTDIFSANFISGFNIGNVLDISYTLRTDFSTTGGKLSVGFIYRFK